MNGLCTPEKSTKVYSEKKKKEHFQRPSIVQCIMDSHNVMQAQTQVKTRCGMGNTCDPGLCKTMYLLLTIEIYLKTFKAGSHHYDLVFSDFW